MFDQSFLVPHLHDKRYKYSPFLFVEDYFTHALGAKMNFFDIKYEHIPRLPLSFTVPFKAYFPRPSPPSHDSYLNAYTSIIRHLLSIVFPTKIPFGKTNIKFLGQTNLSSTVLVDKCKGKYLQVIRPSACSSKEASKLTALLSREPPSLCKEVIKKHKEEAKEKKIKMGNVSIESLGNHLSSSGITCDVTQAIQFFVPDPKLKGNISQKQKTASEANHLLSEKFSSLIEKEKKYQKSYDDDSSAYFPSSSADEVGIFLPNLQYDWSRESIFSYENINFSRELENFMIGYCHLEQQHRWEHLYALERSYHAEASYPTSGFSPFRVQQYVKLGFCYTPIHDEIGFSCAMNYMKRSSLAAAIWVSFDGSLLREKGCSSDDFRELYDSHDVGKMIQNLYNNDIPIEIAFQYPGDTIVSTCGDGSVHLVITDGLFAEQLAWNSTFTIDGIANSLRSLRGNGVAMSANSALAGVNVLPWMYLYVVQGLDIKMGDVMKEILSFYKFLYRESEKDLQQWNETNHVEGGEEEGEDGQRKAKEKRGKNRKKFNGEAAFYEKPSHPCMSVWRPGAANQSCKDCSIVNLNAFINGLCLFCHSLSHPHRLPFFNYVQNKFKKSKTVHSASSPTRSNHNENASSSRSSVSKKQYRTHPSRRHKKKEEEAVEEREEDDDEEEMEEADDNENKKNPKLQKMSSKEKEKETNDYDEDDNDGDVSMTS